MASYDPLPHFSMSKRTLTALFKIFHFSNLCCKLPNVIIQITTTLHNKLLEGGDAIA